MAYSYDAAGTLNRISARNSYSLSPDTPYRYEESRVSPDSAHASSAEWNYRYDTLGRLQKVNPDSAAADSAADATYEYSDNGRWG